MTIAAAILSFLAGIAVERALARNRITKRQAALRELQMQLSCPLDFALCDESGFWQARG